MELTPTPYHKEIVETLGGDTQAEMVIINKPCCNGPSSGVVASAYNYIGMPPVSSVSPEELKANIEKIDTYINSFRPKRK